MGFGKVVEPEFGDRAAAAGVAADWQEPAAVAAALEEAKIDAHPQSTAIPGEHSRSYLAPELL